MTDSLRRLTRSALVFAAFTCWASRADGQNVVHEGFESPETTWREAGGDVPRYQVTAHQRTSSGVHSGAGCEFIQVVAGDGTSIRFGLDIGKARIIEELKATLWVKADRPGIQILARVVLPRTVDPRTGKPVVRYVAGSSYTDVDRWQELRINDIPRALQQQVRALWGALDKNVDAHEAYLDRLVLNVYGGRGQTRVWIDDLAISGLVEADHVDRGASDAAPEAPVKTQIATEQRRLDRPKVTLSSSILLVDDRPLFPRLIEYQGESLAYLKELGFNGILLKELPSAALLDEVARVGLWLVCPPPQSAGLNDPDALQGSLAPIDSRYDPVLAWHLGQRLSNRELKATRRWAEEVRRADRGTPRPIVCEAESELKSYSRIPAAILLSNRSPLGTSLELADYGHWLYQRPRLALAGTPFWATIQTQLAPELLDQVSLLAAGRGREPSVTSEQLQLLTHAALSAGARGLAFASRSPLDASDSETRQRARTLELINHELELIQPWAAAGVLRANVSASDASGTSTGVTGAVLQTDRTRLLLPVWLGTGGQYVPDQSAGNNVTFVVPGAPESHKALEITAGGLRPAVKQNRKVGGMHVQLEEFSLTAMVLLTDDVTIGRLTKQMISTGPKMAQIAHDIAAHKLNEAEHLNAELARRGHPSADAPQWLSEAKLSLAAAGRSLAGRDYRGAAVGAQRAMRPLRLLERQHWEKAIAVIGSPVSSPLAVNFATLPQQWAFLSELDSAERSRNLLPEGGMEDFRRMLRAGWRLYSSPRDDSGIAARIRAAGELSATPTAFAGAYSFRFTVAPTDPEKPVELVETPPLWLVTPPVHLQAGQWVRIHGWALVPQPITGSFDGLQIFDSFGGEPLSERIGEAKNWKEFTLYRAAPATGPLTITIAMTGLGEAFIDNLTVELVARRPPATRPDPLGPRRSAGRPAIRAE